jgi:opacity protein-like surface antigen
MTARWTLPLLLVASPALAQETEVSLLAGYTTPGSIDKKAQEIQDLAIGGSFTWGADVGHFFWRNVGVSVLWTQQLSSLNLQTTTGSTSLFDVKVGQLHGNVVYRFGADHARLSPFVLAGLGAAFLSADNLESETKFSWALGAGLKWFPFNNFGAKVQARYTQIQLNDASSTYCDPFGFCQGSLHQFEFMGGVTYRF